MVAWLAGGGVAGFDPLTNQPAFIAQFIPTTPGLVDTNSVTRQQYIKPGVTIYGFAATVNLRIDAADVAAATSRGARVSATMYVVKDSLVGSTPTPETVVAVATSAQGDVHRSYIFAPASMAAGTSQNISFPFPVRNMGLEPNTKYWVVVTPTYVRPGQVGPIQDIPFGGLFNYPNAKGVSVWTNRTPAAPVITSPARGTTLAEGESFTLSVEGRDADASFMANTPEARDWAGIQVQYARRPTVTVPTPEWTDLPFGNVDETGFEPGWSFKGNWHAGAEALRQLGSVEVQGGALSPMASVGALPSGDWQIRVRTFDWGHPYPLTVNPGPNGAPGKPHTYPAVNTSPWSTPVNVSVTARVPSPLLLAPSEGTAVAEGTPITLMWRYRNTATPPSPQKARTVQMRAVGDENWTTLITGESTSSTLQMTGQAAGTERVANGDFETGLSTGWTYEGANPSPSMSVVSGIYPEVYSGSHALFVDPQTGYGAVSYPITLEPDDVAVGFSGRVRNESEAGAVTAHLVWLDDNDNGWEWHTFPTVRGAEWQRVFDAAPRPEWATKATLTFYVTDFMVNFDGYRLDEISVVGLTDDPIPFDLIPTKQYEWRVQATDDTDVVSNFSEPSRFWVVPAPASGVVDVLPTETIDGATLGCGTHRVFIYKRGGEQRIGEIKGISSLDWERVRDDISTAKITVAGWDIDCGNLLSRLEPWEFEIVVFRNNGFSVDRVWEGPITLLTYETDKVTIQAKDVMAYAYRRIIRQLMSDMKDGDTVVSRAARILQNVFAPDDPNVLAYLQVLARTDDARQYRHTPAYSRTAFEEIDDMASNSGLDYTTVGRAIMLWSTKHRIGTLPEFRDKDLGNSPIVSVYGMSTSTRYVVSDGNGVWGAAVHPKVAGVGREDGVDDNVGLLEMLSSTWASDSNEADTGTYTQEQIAKTIASFEEFAARAVSDRFPPPVVVRIPDNTTLNPSAVISIQHLVPGVVIPLRSTSTLRTVVASQKLDSIKVTETGGLETITVTMSPFNRDDNDMVEGEAE